MSTPTLHLLAKRRFLPLFVTQFCGALNDNLFKNALVILVTYRLADRVGMSPTILATVAAGIFILPFFLFSATAGRLADRFDKRLLTLGVKASEIAFMAIAAIGFFTGSVTLLMIVLFLMGTHSSFFGPIKYGILPQHLAPGELLAGNALVEAGTFIAILLGTIAGGVLVLLPGGLGIVSAAVLGVAILGLAAAMRIPPAPPPAPELMIGWNIAAATAAVLREAMRESVLRRSMLGISWFWLVGATFLSQFPGYAKETLGADEHVVTLVLTAFSIGIAAGSMLCNRILKGQISARTVPWGALGISLFAIDLYFASGSVAAHGAALVGIGEYLSHPQSWRVLVDLTGVAVSGGLFIVPLYTLLQSRGDPAQRSRIIAANNVLNACFMVLAAVAAVVMLKLGLSVPDVFLATAIANFGAVAASFRLTR